MEDILAPSNFKSGLGIGGQFVSGRKDGGYTSNGPFEFEDPHSDYWDGSESHCAQQFYRPMYVPGFPTITSNDLNSRDLLGLTPLIPIALTRLRILTNNSAMGLTLYGPGGSKELYTYAYGEIYRTSAVYSGELIYTNPNASTVSIPLYWLTWDFTSFVTTQLAMGKTVSQYAQTRCSFIFGIESNVGVIPPPFWTNFKGQSEIV